MLLALVPVVLHVFHISFLPGKLRLRRPSSPRVVSLRVHGYLFPYFLLQSPTVDGMRRCVVLLRYACCQKAAVPHLWVTPLCFPFFLLIHFPGVVMCLSLDPSIFSLFPQRAGQSRWFCLLQEGPALFFPAIRGAADGTHPCPLRANGAGLDFSRPGSGRLRCWSPDAPLDLLALSVLSWIPRTHFLLLLGACVLFLFHVLFRLQDMVDPPRVRVFDILLYTCR